MISKTIGCRGTLFSDKPLYVPHLPSKQFSSMIVPATVTLMHIFGSWRPKGTNLPRSSCSHLCVASVGQTIDVSQSPQCCSINPSFLHDFARQILGCLVDSLNFHWLILSRRKQENWLVQTSSDSSLMHPLPALPKAFTEDTSGTFPPQAWSRTGSAVKSFVFLGEG